MKSNTILLPDRIRWTLTASVWGGYILAFFALQSFTGTMAISLSIFPVMVTSWHFGTLGGPLAFLSAAILNAGLLVTQHGYTLGEAFLSRGVLLGDVMLFFVASGAGYVSNQIRKHKQEILRRKDLEREQEISVNFLALLNDIVSAALATDHLKAMLQILAGRVNELLGTDSSYICLWDDEQELTIPVEAHGLNRDAAMELSFAPGEKTLTAYVLKAKSALVVEDFATSAYCNYEKNKEIYKGSMLCVPLIAGDRKLGSILLSFNGPHHFTQDEIARGEMAARHISLALDKSLLLENAERNLKELSLVNRIFAAISSTLNLQDSLQLIADEILSALSALHVGIALIKSDRTELVLTADAPENPNGDSDIGFIIPIDGNPATEKVLAERKPLFIGDAQNNPLTEPIHGVMGLRGTQSLHLLPLFAGEVVIGTVGIDFPEPNRDLDNDERRLVETVLLQASTVIKTSHLFQQTQRSNEELAVMNEIVSSATQSLKLDEILDTMLERLTEILGFSSGLVTLWNHKTEQLELVASRNMPEALVQQIQATGLKHTPCNYVFETQQPLVIKDFNKVPGGVDVSGLIGSGFRVYLSAPIVAKGQVLGTFCILDTSPIEISESKLAMAQSVGRQIGFAIENSRLFEAIQRQAKQQTALFQLSTELATAPDEKSIAHQLLNSLCHTLGYDYLGFYLVDKKSGDRVLQASAGWLDTLEITRIPPGCGLTERPLLDGQLHYTPDVRKDPFYMAGVGTGSEVDVPVWIEGKVDGILAAEKKEIHAFDRSDFDVLSAAANLAGLALTRARLIEATRQQARQQATLFQLSNDLATHLEEQAICRKVVDALREALGFTHVGLFIVDQFTDERVLLAGTTKANNTGLEVRIPPGQGLSERPLLDNKLHYTPDIRNEPVYFPAAGGSEVDVPVRIGAEVGGVLVAEDEQINAFDQSDFDLLTAVANLTGLALTRSRLFSAERRQFDELATLHAVALAITEATDEDKLMERVTQIIGASLYPDNFGILLVDGYTGALQVHPSYSIQKELLDKGTTVPFGQGVVGRVLETGLPERIADVTLSPYYLDLDSRTRSELAVPLRIGQRVIGVINAESTKPNAFSDEDERILITLAGHLAMAINRLRATVVEHQWTEKLARSNALIAALGHVAARIGSAPDIEGVMRTLGEELRTLNLTCLVALYTPSDNPEISIRYTSLPQRIVRLFERASGYKMGEFRISPEKLSAHTDLIRRPRPAILSDSLGAAAEILGGFPRSKIAGILRSAGVSEKVHIGHFPLMIEQKVQGLLWLWGESLHEDDLPAMSIFANQVAIAIENARLFGEVQRLASIDELTGLYNRRHFLDIAQVEFSRGLRYGRSLSAMLLDIDHFKDFNDTYGHAIGDKVLQVVARHCKQSLRNTDILGRYGGEEFAILLPETKLEVARAVAERLRKSISDALIPTEKGKLTVTISIGVAENSKLTPTLETLIARADQAMYVAKHKGRNRVATSI